MKLKTLEDRQSERWVEYNGTLFILVRPRLPTTTPRV